MFMMLIIEEFGSFDNYIWGFVDHNPIVGHFRPRQVPIGLQKLISSAKTLFKEGSEELARRLFTLSCKLLESPMTTSSAAFRFQRCLGAANAIERVDVLVANVEGTPLDNGTESGLSRMIDDLSLST